MGGATTSRLPRVLAVESSCDETAAAVVEGARVRSSVVASQIEVHARFGGVVPELASRHHLGAVVQVVERALDEANLGSVDQLDAIAVTEGPGLMGALLVGVMTARGMAAASGLPLVGVHHMEGHLFSTILGDETRAPRVFQPHLALLVSGGHTEIVRVHALARYERLGATRDDAVGEAYDKVAKMLGIGYPGGPIIDELAAEGDAAAIAFPRAMIDSSDLDFSFSGLKTAVLTHIEKHGEPSSRAALADLCASFQAAVVEVLVTKMERAHARVGVNDLPIHVAGGVAANRGLRAGLESLGRRLRVSVEAAPLAYCGDNAAMIAAAAAARIQAGLAGGVDVHSSRSLDDPRVSR